MWLRPGFIERNRAAFEGYEERLKLLGPLPSFQDNLATLDGLRRQLSCTVLNPSALHEVRYPYLDRDLLEFLYAIPREQLVRPGQRRSLMRRALAGVVPTEILERKRKAFVARSAVKRLATDWNRLSGLAYAAGGAFAEIVDVDRLAREMQAALSGQEVPLPALLRTLGLLAWWKTIEGQTVYSRNHLAFAATSQGCLAGGLVHSRKERR